jgi:hypothetical protein
MSACLSTDFERAGRRDLVGTFAASSRPSSLSSGAGRPRTPPRRRWPRTMSAFRSNDSSERVSASRKFAWRGGGPRRSARALLQGRQPALGDCRRRRVREHPAIGLDDAAAGLRPLGGSAARRVSGRRSSVVSRHGPQPDSPIGAVLDLMHTPDGRLAVESGEVRTRRGFRKSLMGQHPSDRHESNRSRGMTGPLERRERSDRQQKRGRRLDPHEPRVPGGENSSVVPPQDCEREAALPWLTNR